MLLHHPWGHHAHVLFSHFSLLPFFDGEVGSLASFSRICQQHYLSLPCGETLFSLEGNLYLIFEIFTHRHSDHLIVSLIPHPLPVIQTCYTSLEVLISWFADDTPKPSHWGRMDMERGKYLKENILKIEPLPIKFAPDTHGLWHCLFLSPSYIPFPLSFWWFLRLKLHGDWLVLFCVHSNYFRIMRNWLHRTHSSDFVCLKSPPKYRNIFFPSS